jgi:hypothetical protein
VTDSDLRRQRLGGTTARLEHVAIEVDGLMATVEKLRRSGVEMTSEEPTLVGATRSFFTRPETGACIIYQLFDRPARSRTDS